MYNKIIQKILYIFGMENRGLKPVKLVYIYVYLNILFKDL